MEGGSTEDHSPGGGGDVSAASLPLPPAPLKQVRLQGGVRRARVGALVQRRWQRSRSLESGFDLLLTGLTPAKQFPGSRLRVDSEDNALNRATACLASLTSFFPFVGFSSQSLWSPGSQEAKRRGPHPPLVLGTLAFRRRLLRCGLQVKCFCCSEKACLLVLAALPLWEHDGQKRSTGKRASSRPFAHSLH